MSEIRVKSVRNGVVRVQAAGCGVPGLAISPAIDTPGWMITHTRSGLGVAWFPDADPEAVLAAAQALAELGDWTVSAPDITDALTAADVMSVCGRWGARLYSGGDVPDRFDDVPAVTP